MRCCAMEASVVHCSVPGEFRGTVCFWWSRNGRVTRHRPTEQPEFVHTFAQEHTVNGRPAEKPPTYKAHPDMRETVINSLNCS